MMVRTASLWLLALGLAATPAWPQDAGVNDDVQQGHHLALLICANCHVAASDQQFDPILRPPAPTFQSIAQRSTTTADWLKAFLTSNHRDISKPEGMPNPQLMDYQVRQVSAYLLSLPKQP
jgi:mono/diheme cytochrome c family protein